MKRFLLATSMLFLVGCAFRIEISVRPPQPDFKQNDKVTSEEFPVTRNMNVDTSNLKDSTGKTLEEYENAK